MTPRLWLALACAGAVLATAGGLYVKGRSDAAAKWRPKVEAAQAQAQSETNARTSVERYTREVRVIEKAASDAKQVIDNDPGASDDFAVRDELCNQLARLRDGEPACVSSGPPDLPGGVREAEGEPPY